ncbi:helix-turn-helix domain-containing protein [Bacillus thuringiensis]|uniref:helix-turn-helix domain-containing protein n=1 Tax=Bacillus thuringiensis TaxID=1428 RepID=UPI0011A138DA|nr:helix-turn-helix transcriptional regulator [Bacillus thuringiensis]
MSLNERLRICRERKGFTQIFIAEKLSVNKATLSSYESGRRKPDYETLTKLADIYEVSIDYLLGRSIHQKLSFEENEEIHAETNEWMTLINQLSEDNKKLFKTTIQNFVSKDKTP